MSASISTLAHCFPQHSTAEPIVQFVDHLIAHACEQGASDIHLEPFEKNCRIRYRQDGLLYWVAELDNHFSLRVITRLKVLANLDIAERRLPQDGRIQWQGELILRVNTCPVLYGEKIVLRLLDNSQQALDLAKLGLTEAQRKLFLSKLDQPQGLILVTGPTGSGKTVSLYSALSYLNKQEKNISSVEDPIEIQLAGINQVAVNPKAGLEFAAILRAFLRQDPDVIMVGEIRDRETAEVAIQAAQTGHLVLSTLHTNSALETLQRLLSMQLAPYHLIHALSLIIAQRLLRKLCVHCKIPDVISAATLASLGFSSQQAQLTIYRAQGCGQCRRGYKGRIAIFECLALTRELSLLMLQASNPYELQAAAVQKGFSSLQENGFEQVKAGLTSLHELKRVLQNETAV